MEERDVHGLFDIEKRLRFRSLHLGDGRRKTSGGGFVHVVESTEQRRRGPLGGLGLLLVRDGERRHFRMQMWDLGWWQISTTVLVFIRGYTVRGGGLEAS